MNFIFIIFGVLTVTLYGLYSRKEGTYVNALTALTFFKCVVEFCLEPLSYNLHLFEYDAGSFFKIYLASFTAYSFMLWGVWRKHGRTCKSPIKLIVKDLVPWIFLAGAIALYLPVLIEFKDYIFDPRYIYERTRTGYGVQFFGSALLANCALILFLFSKRKQHLLFILILLLFTLLKGSKGQILTIIVVYGIWAVYVLRVIFTLRRTLIISILASIGFGALFVLNYRGEINSLVLVVASYSDYNRNASLIVSDTKHSLHKGRIMYENVFYSKIPRFLWESKPKNFGQFSLAEEYFPVWFELDQGAPSFGIGVYFADFGWLAYLVIALFNFLGGRFLRRFIHANERKPNIFNFVMLLFFAEVTLLPAGVGYFLIEHLILAWLLQYLIESTNRRNFRIVI